MNRLLSIVMVLMAGSVVSQAQSLRGNAQTPVPGGSGDFPRYEIGLNMGLWTLEGEDGLLGLRWSHRVRGPIAVEASFDKQSGDSGRMPYRMFIINGRFLQRAGVPGARLFATGGVARGYGLRDYAWSPVVGFGGQSQFDGPIEVRVEVQVFTRGQEGPKAERSRLLFGMSIGL